MNSEQFTGAAAQTATQFVIAQEKIGLLLGTGGKTFKRIGSLFKVHIHLTSGHHQSGEWVSIYGKEEDRGRAKEYIMSMCNPLVEEKIPYSADLHEHLVGKGGKTHRYLESNSSAVITFSTSCTGPNEHTAHVRGSKESVAHATALIKEIIRKTTKRRQKENQPPTNVKPEDLDKELLHALKAENNLSLWDTIKNQPEEAKRAHLAQLHRRKVQGGAENSPSSSSEGGLEDGISSTADLLAYTKKLKLPEDVAKKLLNEQAQPGSGYSKNDFIANMLQLQARENEVRKSEQSPASGALGGLYRPGYGVPEFRSYPGLVSDCAQDFRLEQPGSSFDQIPLGMTARSIVPHPPSMLPPPTHQLDLSSEFSSAPANSHPFSGSRYDPANARTLNEVLFGNSAPPNAHLPHSTSLHAGQQLRDENDALLIKILLEQQKEKEQLKEKRVQELLLRHSQQRYLAQQQQQQKLMQLREHQVNQLSNEDLFSLYKQRQFYQGGAGAGSAAGGGANLPGSGLGLPSSHSSALNLSSPNFGGSAPGFSSGVMGSSGLGSTGMNSAPNLGAGASANPQIGSSLLSQNNNGTNVPSSAGPLSPGTPSYELFSNGNMYRNGAPPPAPPTSEIGLDLLRDAQSSEQVAELIKHLNL